MRRFAFAAFTAMLLAGCAGAPIRAPQTPTSAATSDVANVVAPRAAQSLLASNIDLLLAQPRFAHASWGIDVVSLDSGKTLYARNADTLFLPASNAKLYTATLALQTLGADASFSTTLYATTTPRINGTLSGDLILYGRGDPSLGEADVSPDWADRLAQALSERGVRRVRGNLIADDTYFSGPLIGDGWEALDLQDDYGAQAGALGAQDGVVRVTVARNGTRCCAVTVDPPQSGLRVINLTGASAPLSLYRPPGSDVLYASGSLPANQPQHDYNLSVPDAALFAANLLRDALARHGIALSGNVRVVHWPERDAAFAKAPLEVASISSPPLSQLLRHMLKTSDNRYAQMLLQQVGLQAARGEMCADREEPPQTSADWGLCGTRAFLTRIGIGNDEAMFDEGSGLSRRDLVTPAATVKLLAWLARQPFANVLRDALPLAGVDGTLKSRMLGTTAAGNLQAKTGTLTHAYALSGYVTDARGEHLAFSLMLNRYQRPTDALGNAVPPSPQDDLDAVAEMIVESH
ncbi:MAG TPA: D-alanyl-D-alanine carboxypeptidase/D-alanyl-D-alanine-endopeptidase [Rhodanobacteraceae bacterium]|nr:D-alanyl-D-alanine carboxypeptidase/D-alanyl-D-alanine-endopeptidase [Rhodanobacteraceae bacterium]